MPAHCTNKAFNSKTEQHSSEVTVQANHEQNVEGSSGQLTETLHFKLNEIVKHLCSDFLWNRTMPALTHNELDFVSESSHHPKYIQFIH